MRRKIAVFLLIFICLFSVLAANKTVTVKPSGGTYTTLQGAITGELVANANLVTMEGILTISIEGDWTDAPDTTAVTINGFTTSATYYLKIVTDSANRAVKTGIDTTRYILAVTDDDAIDIRDDYVRIDGLQIQSIYVAADYKAGIITQSIAATNNDIRISNCYIEGSSTAYYYGIRFTDGDEIASVWNTIISTFSVGINFPACTGNVFNSIVYNIGTDGIFVTLGATVSLINNAIFSCADDIDDRASSTIDYNATDDNDGTNNVDETGGIGLTWADSYPDAATGNFTLKVGSPLIGAGAVDPGSGLFSDDIEGNTRGVAWDLGVDEYVAAVGGLSIPVAQAYYRRFRN